MDLSALIAARRASLAGLTARADALRSEGEAILAAVTAEARTELTDEERATHLDLIQQRGTLTEQITALTAEIATLEQERAADAEIDRRSLERTPAAPAPSVRVVSEENPVYRRGDTENSYFRDIFDATRGSQEASRRLADSQVRAATSAAGSGGEFAPPAWLVEDFVEIARAGRVAADLMQRAPLPEGVSSVNLPKVTDNTDPVVTQTQNTTITEEAFTTTSVSSGIAEISGKQTVPIGLLRQSGVPIDRVILGDLARGYAVTLDKQVIQGSNANGQLRGLITAGTTVTYTTTQPVQASTSVTNSFYSKVLGGQSALAAARFLPADTLLMHPTRWLWVLNGYDGNGRPLVPPTGPGQNAPGISGEPVAQGYAGEWAGQPVYVDPNIPTNLGVATNQDVVFVLRADDLWLWESDVETASFDATLAAQNSILYRVLGFAAFIPHRHQASVQVIAGTGLVAPSF